MVLSLLRLCYKAVCDGGISNSNILCEVDRYTVGKITPVPMREVRSSDFGEQARIRMYFPRTGSRLTPPHHSIDFYWKDYCPMVFRYVHSNASCLGWMELLF